MHSFKNIKIAKKKAVELVKQRCSASILMQMDCVFNKHNWEIVRSDGTYSNRYEKYKVLLDNLEDDEQSLILELTDRFIHIKNRDYDTAILPAIRSLLDSNPDVTQYYVLPALSKEDRGKTCKSSNNVQYLFSGDYFEDELNCEGVNFQVVKDINVLKKRIKPLKPHERILFVDDFIGSGDTAIDSAEEFKDSPFGKDSIIFLSIVAHNMGVEILKENNHTVFYSILVSKGITNYYEGDLLNRNIDIMQRIEDRIKPSVTPEKRFGHKHCEALVSMHRIPNNTFPIYWLDKKISPYDRK